MKNIIIGLCIIFGSLVIINSVKASEVEALIDVLIKNNVISEGDAADLKSELKLEQETSKVETKVEIKEELSKEGIPLASGAKVKFYGSLDIVGYTQEGVNFTKGNTVAFAENIAKLGAKTQFTDEVSGDFRIVSANTSGDDSLFYGTATDNTMVDVDLANLTFSDIGSFNIDLTLGRQEIVIGDGFIIGDGRADTVAQWSVPLKSFDGARATLNNDFGTVDCFAAFIDNDWTQYLGSYDAGPPEYQDQLPLTAYTGGGELYGVNLHHEKWDIGAFFKDDNSELENDTVALSVKALYEVPAISGLTLDGEIVRQLGSTSVDRANLLTDRKLDREAWGGHMDATYKFESCRFAPYIGTSYIYFSGDDADSTDTNEAFDPLFFDDTDNGKWYIGNIVGGQGQIINSNEKVIKLELGCTPDSSTQLRLQFFNIRLDRGIDYDFTRKNYANEVNLIFDYWPNEIFYCGAQFGMSHPLEAARYWNADANTGKEATENIYEFVVWAGVEF
ncbi:MAG: alginate export family protein [Candidatus Omnitrophica bacterium]|nr:alginate export family protein [Candidatus Omnitrophota bacterium]